MQKLYRVTEKRNLPGILSQGLVPKIGPRSRAAGEPVPAIYPFPSLADLSDGFLNWMERAFDEADDPILLEASVPEGIRLIPDGWEISCREPIPPECVRIMPGYL